MKTTLSKALIVISALAVFFSFSSSQPTGLEIIKESDKRGSSNDQSVTVTMELINKKGAKQTRKLEFVEKTSDDNKRSSLISFIYPTDVKGTGFLSIENTDRDDDRWLYMPALKRIRRISASSKGDSFMGSDFSYEDLEREKFDKNNYTLVESKTIDGKDCYVVDCQPKNADILNSSYTKKRFYIAKSNYVAVKIEYYDKENALFKIYTATEIKEISGSGKRRAHFMKMENLKTGHKTTLKYEGYKINQGLSDRFFTKQYLEERH